MFIIHQYNTITSGDYIITASDAVLQGSRFLFIYPLFIRMDWDVVREQRALCLQEKIKDVHSKHEGASQCLPRQTRWFLKKTQSFDVLHGAEHAHMRERARYEIRPILIQHYSKVFTCDRDTNTENCHTLSLCTTGNAPNVHCFSSAANLNPVSQRQRSKCDFYCFEGVIRKTHCMHVTSLITTGGWKQGYSHLMMMRVAWKGRGQAHTHYTVRTCAWNYSGERTKKKKNTTNWLQVRCSC